MAPGHGQDFRGIPSRPNPYVLYPWLFVCTGAVHQVLAGKWQPAWLAGVLLAAFITGFMAVTWLGLRTSHGRIAWVLLAALGAITLVLNLVVGGDMAALYPLLALACGAVIPWTERPGPPLPLVAVLIVAGTGAVITWTRGSPGGDVWQVLYGSLLAGVVTAVVFRLIEAVRELHLTQEELARAAVDEERLRFARDLHDLLSHTLSVMVIKAQAVRKLAPRDPQAAAEQAADIENVGRQALTEVRQAVTGYRGRGLARELDAARITLADAGFTTVINGEDRPVPEQVDAMLGWVIREGVTNVIKHSGGHLCEISVRQADGHVTLEITDDGNGGPVSSALPAGGHGLGGLMERTAAEGGTLRAGPRRGGGFRLIATIPIPRGEVPSPDAAVPNRDAGVPAVEAGE
jgi:two-component system, NarL family, sensor histidine kinase DesK